VDKELKDWILPNFTTTRHNDIVVSSVLMMATLKAYVILILLDLTAEKLTPNPSFD
jgi:Domain of unknown function (DUF4419)